MLMNLLAKGILAAVEHAIETHAPDMQEEAVREVQDLAPKILDYAANKLKQLETVKQLQGK